MCDEATTQSRVPVPADLRVAVSSSNGGAAVVLVGELDLATAPQLADALGTVSGVLDIDCRALTFIDGAGIAALLQVSRRTTIRLHQPSPIASRMITILGLDSIFFNGETSRQADLADGASHG